MANNRVFKAKQDCRLFMQKEDEMFSNGIPNIFAGYRILTGFESLNILPDIVESNRFENSIVYTYIHELKNPL